MNKYVALAALMTAMATPVAAQPVVAPAPGAPMMAPMSAESFRQMAIISDTFEIESSRIALERSRSPAVRRFADMMIQDHGAISQALMGGGGAPMGAAGGAVAGAVVGAAVAGPVGAVVGAGVGAGTGATAGAAGNVAALQSSGRLDARRADMLNQLASARGPGFDRLYGRMQYAGHQEAVAMYSAYAQGGSDPGLRTFAQQALPTLQQHLAMAARMTGARMAAPRGRAMRQPAMADDMEQ